MNQNSLAKSPAPKSDGNLQLASEQPLSALYNPAIDQAVAAGEIFELRVTVTNQGLHGAVINIYLDETCQPLWTWCAVSTQNLALDPYQSSEVLFQIPLPLAAPPGTYNYLVVIDAPEHYPESNPLQHQGQLHILPPVQSVVKVNDPTFQLLPPSNSLEPLAILPGTLLELGVMVFNRSHRVDRFRVNCLDLPQSWWTALYPEGMTELGLAIARDSLALNPNTHATMVLRIHPPGTVDAGNYQTSIQLKSVNNPELVLIDICYFQIAPQHQLSLNLAAIRGRVERSPGEFKLRLNNPGNTVREVSLVVAEEPTKYRCEYTLSSTQVKLLPQTSQEIKLEVKPKQYWRRPWLGKGARIKFKVAVRDLYQLPLTKSQLASELHWSPRPWWHLALVVVSSVSAIAGLLLLLWWLLFRPRQAPEVKHFAAESSVYQAADDEFVRLNWQILRPQQIESITVTGRSPDAGVSSQAITYDLSAGLPPELADFCTIKPLLNCRHVRTDARKAGEYTFELRVNPRKSGQKPSAMTTDAITIQPAPSPKITQFAVYQDPATTQTINLDFTLNHLEQLTALELTGYDATGAINYPLQSYGITEGEISELQPYCQTVNQTLTCQQVPLNITQNDTYTFTLTALQTSSAGAITPADSQQAPPLNLESPAPPQAANLMANQPLYQEQSEQPIHLNWDVFNPQELATLKLIGRSPEGIVTSPPITYDFRQGVPSELEAYCQIIDGLRCRNFPTAAIQAGDYIFELMLTSKQNPQLVTSTIKSDRIRIESIPLPPPPPTVITSLEINGIDAPAKHIVPLAPQQQPESLEISWSVLTSAEATIELLPAPGQVSASGTITYPLSSQPQTETLTLRVTEPSGKKVERSLIIETTTNSEQNSDPLEQNLPPSDRPDDILTPIDSPPELN